MQQQLQWKTENRKVDTLLPHKKSPRKISKEQMEILKRSLEAFNLVEIPAIDLDGTILAGHQRIKVLQALGRGGEAIDVRVPNRKLTDEEAEGYLIGSNAIHADWDLDLLKNFDVSLLIDLGFDQKVLDDIWNKKLAKDTFDVEEELKKIKEPTTKFGDIILLGSNKLICGDSLRPETLQKLFGEERASMIISDPIYNISVDYNGGIGGKQQYGGTVNDNKPDAEYKEFLKKSMEAALAVTKGDAHVFYWSDQTYIWLIQTLYRDLGITNKRVAIWLKNSQNPTPGVAFNKCYEPCTYGVRGKPYIVKGVNNLNEVMNPEMTTGNNLLQEALDHIDIWATKRLAGNQYEHSTMKPPEVYEKAIRRCTKMNEIILDSFSGSGSTLIAGEKLKRRVYAVEIEPVFCDLTIRRYEALTGTKARIVRGNETL
ncbi:TPA: DNA modification methylase [Candidatus Woesearchaeota archaeon]|nr:DNA modification methylase [Candidatus Woesearchaeota archaeon]